jgi:hypothetical protein
MKPQFTVPVAEKSVSSSWFNSVIVFVKSVGFLMTPHWLLNVIVIGEVHECLKGRITMTAIDTQAFSEAKQVYKWFKESDSSGANIFVYYRNGTLEVSRCTDPKCCVVWKNLDMSMEEFKDAWKENGH